MKKDLPLPPKKELRLAAKKYVKPPKSVVSYFKGEECKDLAVVEKSLIIAHRRVYCMFFYNREGLVYVGFINPHFESIGLYVQESKWTQQVFSIGESYYNYQLMKCVYNYDFLTDTVGRKFFRFNGDDTLKHFLDCTICAKKESITQIKREKNMLRREIAFNANYRPINKNFIRWGYRKLPAYGTFSLSDRHTCLCKECDTAFHTEQEIKNGAQIKCPKCKRNLTVKTEKTLPINSEVGCQYIDTDVHGNLVVRHFLFQKSNSTNKKGFLEYERNPFIPYSPFYFEYHIQRWNSALDQYTWRHTKPVWRASSLNAIRDIFYYKEYLYTSNLKKLSETFPQIEFAGLLSVKRNQTLRAEDQLFKYGLAPHLVECLWKSGFGNLVFNSCDDEFKPYKNDSNASRILKGVTPEYKQLLKSSDRLSIYDIPMILKAQRHNISPEKLLIMLKNANLLSDSHHRHYDGNIVSKFISECENNNVSVHKAYRYIVEKGNDFQIWKDYCTWSVKVLGKENIKRNSLFPKNLIAAHDRMFRTYEESICKDSKSVAEMNARCKALYEHLLRHHIGDLDLGNGYAVVVPKDKFDFALEGHNMRICVGGDHYVKNHALGKSVVFFLRQASNINKSFACCEAELYKGKLVLKQCRLHHNDAPDKKTEAAAKAYISKLNKVLKFKNNKINLAA